MTTKKKAPKQVKTSLTEEQLDWLKLHYYDGDWDHIAKEFNKKFDEKKTADAVRILYGRHKTSDLSGAGFKDFTRDSLENTRKINTKEGRFFVTGVMPVHQLADGKLGGQVHMGAMRTLLAQKSQEIVLLPTLAHVRALQSQPDYYDPQLTPYKKLFATELEFNQNLRVVDAKIQPQNRKPLTHILDYTGEGSVIVASPRQHMAIFATGNNTPPGMMASSGVLNYPSYQPNNVGKRAAAKHQIGGRIVEIKGDKFFQRKIRFDAAGGYFDLNTYRHYKGNITSRVEALVVGDIHFGHHVEALMKILFEQITLLQPRILVFHDAFDGLSVSHHLNLVDKILRPSWAYSIETEAAVARKQMLRIKDVAPKDCVIYWADSNHNNFLTRYLKERRYLNDEVNFKLAHKLQLEVLEGRNPLAMLMGLDFIRYLGPNDDLFVKGRQLANHGHSGVNGTKGSKTTLKRTAHQLVTAHGHSPFEEDDHDGVGHWSEDRHGYNWGASTWIPSTLGVQPDGSTQQYLAIKSKNSNLYEWKL